MIRYHYNVTIQGVCIKVNVDARNQMTAQSKVRRQYPMAEQIHLIRSEKISDY